MPEFTCKWQTYNPTEGEHENVEPVKVYRDDTGGVEDWVADHIEEMDTFNERLVITVTKQ